MRDLDFLFTIYRIELSNSLAVRMLGLSAFIARPVFSPWLRNQDPTNLVVWGGKKKELKTRTDQFENNYVSFMELKGGMDEIHLWASF